MINEADSLFWLILTALGLLAAVLWIEFWVWGPFENELLDGDSEK